MSRQVASLPDLIEQQYEDLEPKARSILNFQEIFNIQRIIITGCGDSYAAGLAVKHAFEMLTDIPTEVITAIELSRFTNEAFLGVDCRNPLVIAVSNSGNVARVAEAAGRCRGKGCFVLGISSNMDSLLAKECDKVLQLEIPSFENSPGTRSYLVSVLSLLLLAVRFGEVRLRYTMDQAMDYREDFRKQGLVLREMLSEMDDTCQKVAERWKNLQCFDFIGAGFDYAAAWFGQAKILEATGRWAMHINSEEWFHLNVFACEPEKIGTVIVANTTNPAHERTCEVVKYANILKRNIAVITNGDKMDFSGEEASYIKVPSSKYPISMPLTQFTPLCLIAGYISELNQEKYGRGCEGPWKFCENGAIIRNSKMVIK